MPPRFQRNLNQEQAEALRPVFEKAAKIQDEQFSDEVQAPFYLTREQWLAISYAFEKYR
jgi:hypothetical protein